MHLTTYYVFWKNYGGNDHFISAVNAYTAEGAEAYAERAYGRRPSGGYGKYNEGCYDARRSARGTTASERAHTPDMAV